MFIAIILTVVLLACSKEPPKCSDPETITLVKQIIVENYVKNQSKGKLSDKELQDKLQIQYPRATSYDKDIKKYNCEGTLVIPGKGDPFKIDIKYSSQQEKENQHLVALRLVYPGESDPTATPDMILLSKMSYNKLLSDAITGNISEQDPLDQEALDIAKKISAPYIIKCGDQIYMRSTIRWNDRRSYARSKGETTIDVFKYTLTQADKMNGVEWSGNFRFHLADPVQEASDSKEYGEWKEVSYETDFEVTVLKKGGKWVTEYNKSFSPLTCEEALNPTGNWPIGNSKGMNP